MFLGIKKSNLYSGLFFLVGAFSFVAALNASESVGVNARGEPGWRTPWVEAVLMDNVYILPDGRDGINVGDDYGWTPLTLAVRTDKVRMAKFLLDRGADINARDKSGRTPWLHAVSKGNVDMVRLLLDRGADINARDVHGNPLLINAIRDDNVDMVRLLLDRGADINARDAHGNPLLIDAIREDNVDMVRLLLDKGADIASLFNRIYGIINQPDEKKIFHVFVQKRGQEMLYLAAQRSYDSLLKKLFEAGVLYPTEDQIASLNLSDDQKETLLWSINTDRARLKGEGVRYMLKVLDYKNLPDDLIFEALVAAYGQNVQDEEVRLYLERFIETRDDQSLDKRERLYKEIGLE